jgi:hypothetical protein
VEEVGNCMIFHYCSSFVFYFSGDFEFKQNENLPPQEQLATCNPELIYVSVTMFPRVYSY